MNDLQKVFFSELKDIYDGETQITKALPKMERWARSDDLKLAFHQHLEQTQQHLRRLEMVFQDLGEEPKRKICQALKGIIDEGELIAQEFADNSALDVALIAAAQKVEHYEITSYGTLCSWAKDLGYDRSVELLQENLAEEKVTDQRLSSMAESGRNREASLHDTDKKSEASAKIRNLVGMKP